MTLKITIASMGDAEHSRKGNVLRAYTKAHDSENNSATVLVITHCLMSLVQGKMRQCVLSQHVKCV